MKVDVRVIAATTAAGKGRGRGRVSRGFILLAKRRAHPQLPALRERREDIPQLVSYFLSKIHPTQTAEDRAARCAC